MWILIDMSNGGATDPRTAGKIYFWTFKTKKAALYHKSQGKQRNWAECIGPFKVRDIISSPGTGGSYKVLERG